MVASISKIVSPAQGVARFERDDTTTPRTIRCTGRRASGPARAPTPWASPVPSIPIPSPPSSKARCRAVCNSEEETRTATFTTGRAATSCYRRQSRSRSSPPWSAAIVSLRRQWGAGSSRDDRAGLAPPRTRAHPEKRSRQKRLAPASSNVLTCCAAGGSGSRPRPASTLKGSSSSTRPGLPPRWCGAAAGLGADFAAGRRCLTGTGRPPPSSAH